MDKEQVAALVRGFRDYAAAFNNGDEQGQRGALERIGKSLDAMPIVRHAALRLKQAAELVGFDPSEWIYDGKGKLRRVPRK